MTGDTDMTAAVDDLLWTGPAGVAAARTAGRRDRRNDRPGT
jgi:hypothetical protein